MKKIIAIFLFFSCGLLSCNRKEFLDTKPTSELFVPSTLDDFQALLDNERIMPETPILGELSTDNLYLLSTYWQTLSTKEKNAYTWQTDIFQGQGDVQDWNMPYKQVFYANIVLDGIPKVAITNNNEQNFKAIKGAALFARAHAFYNVAQVFAPVYDSRTAITSLGIPLRLTPGVDEQSVRATLQETYDRIIMDLLEAVKLLPVTVPLNNNRNRPCKQAAFAMLARVYLSMSDYPQAKIYADSCLNLYDSLMDYASLPSLTTSLPFSPNNNETLYQSKFLTATSVLRGSGARNTIVDSVLFNSYDPNDLRKIAFFAINASSLPNVKGSYSGFSYCFTGLATDEVYLIRAECQAHTGNIAAAMKDLNTLLEKRWKAGTFVPFVASDPNTALDIILAERRKELPFRGLRWTDIRRLNLTNRKTFLKRKIGTLTFELQPGDLNYVILIPPDVITLSGIQQNPR